jgi:hypothetical protein
MSVPGSHAVSVFFIAAFVFLADGGILDDLSRFAVTFVARQFTPFKCV